MVGLPGILIYIILNMRATVLVLACLACAGHARSVHTTASRDEVPTTSEALARLLGSVDPSAAFQASPAGLQGSGKIRSSEPVQMMARAQPKKVAAKKAAPFWAAAKSSASKAFDPLDYPGIQAPVGYWDPLNMGLGVNFQDSWSEDAEATFLRRRAVELKHGRIGMLACLGYIAPYFGKFPGSLTLDGSVPFADVPIGVKALNVVPPLGLAQIVLLAGALELGPFKNDPANPGDFGWDPLGLKPEDPEALRRKQNIELANGRLAMLASLGFIAGDIINDGNPYVGSPFTP